MDSDSELPKAYYAVSIARTGQAACIPLISFW